MLQWLYNLAKKHLERTMPYQQKSISLIAAVSKNFVLGDDGDIPWHLSKDFAYFKQQTLNKPIIMGRKTFESIGRPLPKRKNIILTRQTDYQPEGVTVCHTIEQALEAANSYLEESSIENKNIMVIGGAQIYKLFLPLADFIYLTEIDLKCKGDAYFPAFDKNIWHLKSSTAESETSQEQLIHFSFNLYQK
jgi:dihydrofolate reductase